MATVDIARLSDEDLREQLQDHGVNVGPITSTTRLFYEKKLGKLMDKWGVPQQPETEESEEDEEEEEEEEDEEVQINYRKQPPVPPKPKFTSTPVEPQRQYQPITQARTATPTVPAQRRNVPGRQEDVPLETRQARTAATSGAQKSGGGGGMAMWLKLFFTILVFALIYLVIVNMNPSAESKIPLSLDEKED